MQGNDYSIAGVRCMDTWRELLSFARAIVSHEVALVTGSVLTALVTAFGAQVRKYSR